MAKQRVDATAAYEPAKKQTVYDKMIAPATPPAQPEQHEEHAPEHALHKGGRTLKQVAFAIGAERERKLDALAFEYNQQKGTRIGRNDIARYLFDTLNLEELLRVDLTEYKK